MPSTPIRLTLNYVTWRVCTYDYEWVTNAETPCAMPTIRWRVQCWVARLPEKYHEAEIEIKKALSLDPNNALAYAYYA
jgi:hypothetical protein